MQFNDQKTLAMLSVWRSGQMQLPQVERWKTIRNRAYNKDCDCRCQNVLEHTYGICVLGRMMIEKLGKYQRLDKELLLTTLLIHDHGEGSLGRDVAHIYKADADGVAEYEQFRNCYSELDPDTFDMFHRAFLLQSLEDEQQAYPADAIHIMDELRATKFAEAQVFSAIERWDYFSYALEQYVHYHNPSFLTCVLRKSMPEFDLYSKEIPGFSAEYWTSSLRDWCVGFFKNNDKRFPDA